MDNHRNTRMRAVTFIAVLFVILIIADRYYWAQISQWREDQATTVWLGYTAGIGNTPVGLISSRYIPNPNGMILLGSVLSLLPNLLSISFVLGILQILLLSLVGWKSFRGNLEYFLLATIPVLSSLILRSTSVELWNQYVVTLVNIFFIVWVMRYLEKPSLWNPPPIAALILLAPSLYLAGLVNAFVMVFITMGMLLYRRPKMSDLWRVTIVLLLILLVSVLLTWLPYFQNVSLRQLADINKSLPGPIAIFKILWESLFGLPVYGTFQWADQSVFPLAFKHANEAILTQGTKILLRLVGRVYLLQAVFAFAAFAYAILQVLLKGLGRTEPRLAVNRPAIRLVILSMLFISLSFAISGWLGGPDWLHGERPDQIVQFLPMFLFFILLLPRLITVEGRVGEIIIGVSYLSWFVFISVNLICGFMVVRDHLQYRGEVLTEADVPLPDKMQVVDFIASDWMQHSASKTVPVDYDIDRGVWDEVSLTEPAIKLTHWYPGCMTEGRGFDYELLRRYGLRNEQEGTQLRKFGDGRYLVTYAFEDPPQVKNGLATHYYFGRLRVSVVEN